MRTILFLLVAVGSAFTKEVVLFDTTTIKTQDLRWDQISLRHDRDDPWVEETWRDGDNKNIPTYVACNYEQQNPSNWLFTPVVPTDDAKSILMQVMFNTRDCILSDETKACKETVAIYAKQYDVEDPPKENIVDKAKFQKRMSEWKQVATLYRKTPNTTTEVVPLTVTAGARAVRFAFEDTGVCVSLLSVKLYYVVCDELTQNFVHYAPVTGPSSMEPLTITGTCVPNSQKKYDIGLTALCMPSGNLRHTTGECECVAGHSSSIVVDHLNETTMHCLRCPVNTFKPRGAGDCISCPANSKTDSEASSSCQCAVGYFRASDDLSTAPCTQTPSRPAKVESTEVTSTSVRLSWDEPSSLGGRKEVWYEVKCGGRGDCSNVKILPQEQRIMSRTVVITGLRPSSDYTFHVYSKNKVSNMGEPKHSIVDVTTKSEAEDNTIIGPLRVDADQSDGVTIGWPTPDPRISEFEVEVSPSLTGKRVQDVRLVNASYTTFIGLKTGVVYAFKVRTKNSPRWSQPLLYELGRGEIQPQSKEKADESNVAASALTDNMGWMLMIIAGILIVIATMLCMLLFQRKSRNRKQMSDLDVLDTYKQDSMTPDYHTTNSRHAPNQPNLPHLHDQFRSVAKLNAPLIPFGSPISQPPPYYGGPATSGKYRAYVDPTAYEDPNQALNEFAFDIDPNDIFITQVIGGGEFGDVCLGGLHRSAILSNKYGTTVSHGRFNDGEQYETVAIKTLKSGSSAKAKSEFLIEASIMGQFTHPNVIRLIGVVTSSEPIMIVTEYMSHGSLDQFLRIKDSRGEKLPWEKICEMLHGIASGMKYLTDMGYVHRDLAARNVLVDEELRCKIADFGLSRGVEGTVEQEYTTNGGKIPVRWTSPEAITHRKFTASSDVWSFGVVVWEVCSYGERPYWDWTNQKVISEVMIGYRLPPPMDCPMGLYRLTQWCWKKERHDRPSFAQLVAMFHKFMLQPHIIHSDMGELPKRSMSTANLTNTYGSITAVPSPPSSAPPIPSLDEFLRSIGMHHCYGQLVAHNVTSLSDLRRTSHNELLSWGLISPECTTLFDALEARNYGHTNGAMQMPTPPGTATLPAALRNSARGSTSRRDEGFFV
ncbi:unnamed protein product [Caenorhabditis auriculariae]|uniref:receptor protein-tyrosine kinase n=1 Tax=Caenorhabditis auriculariae TaxID=2777116 RepID=A0A8S1HBQ5_9PELO|nr:unnamed protein product [Caenorhabditis auriculariae]